MKNTITLKKWNAEWEKHKREYGFILLFQQKELVSFLEHSRIKSIQQYDFLNLDIKRISIEFEDVKKREKYLIEKTVAENKNVWRICFPNEDDVKQHDFIKDSGPLFSFFEKFPWCDMHFEIYG